MSVAVLGGLFAAVCWATAGICAALMGRHVAPTIPIAWANVVALLLASAVGLVLDGVPHDVPASDLGWVVVLGVAIVGALSLAFRAMRIGPVGIVTPVISTEGAVAAAIGVATGDALDGLTGAALAVIVVGVLLTATASSGGGFKVVAGPGRRALVYALGAAVCFGIVLVVGRRAAALGPIWTTGLARGVGVGLFTLPVFARVGWRLPRVVLPLVALNATADFVGFAVFIRATRVSVAIPAVLASQYATLTVAAGFFLFGERLRPWQWLGVALTIAGTAVVAATHG